MEPSISEIQKNYKKMPDKKLLELASYDATGLRPEALQALKRLSLPNVAWTRTLTKP